MHLMNFRCFYNRHAWRYTEHFPAGDRLPDGYTVRKCERCGKVQWNLHGKDTIVPDLGWIQGWPPRSTWTPGIPKPPQGGTGVQKPQRSVESFQVVCEPDPGLWPEEQGTL